MKTYAISVTKEDIENGGRDNISTCPVALAVRRVTKKRFQVGSTEIYPPLSERHFPQPIRISDQVAEFIKRFDAKKRVQPFTFRIKLP